jgi:protein-S-isoprenylcysteine O-methyltransferase Ste14
MVKRIIYPPIWLLFGLIAIFLCYTYVPGPRFSGWVGQVAGVLLIVLGLVLLVVAAGLFSRAKTDLIPFRNVSALVTGGIYRYTRNPMYLGMFAILLGCAVASGASTALLVPPLFAVIIEMRFIRPEEAMLRDLFPAQYPAYCGRVRRWL